MGGLLAGRALDWVWGLENCGRTGGASAHAWTSCKWEQSSRTLQKSGLRRLLDCGKAPRSVEPDFFGFEEGGGSWGA